MSVSSIVPDALVDERGRDVARRGGQPIADHLELSRVRRAADLPRLARFHLRAQQRRRFVHGAERPPERRRGMQRDRDAGDVHELERSHPDPEGLLRGLVDRRRPGDALLEHAHGFGEPRQEEAVDDEAVANRSTRSGSCPGPPAGARRGGAPPGRLPVRIRPRPAGSWRDGRSSAGRRPARAAWWHWRARSRRTTTCWWPGSRRRGRPRRGAETRSS